MSQFLDFLFNNNSMIIQILIPAVLVLVLFLAYRSFSMDDDEETTASGGMSAKELEAALAKVLEKANAVPTPAIALQMEGVKNDEQAQKLLKEIEHLKGELDAAKAGMEQAKTQAAASGSATPAAGADPAETEKLKKQLEEMKAKLGEYEIIAEDIADLSFYKEQAAKLQKEIEVLKGGGKVEATETVVDPAMAALSAAEEEIAIGGSAKATRADGGETEPKPPPAQPEPLPPATTPSPNIPNAPEPPGPVEEPEPKGPPATEPEPVPPPVQGAAEKKEEAYEDILAEFNAVVEEKTGKKIDDLGDLDMDKMLKEAANIKVDVPEVSAEQAIGVELDEKKLIAEAADLDKAVSSEDQKLMGQFEKFVKNE